MGAPEVEAFLTHFAVDRNVAPSTQNQALAALLFLYRELLQLELPWLDEVTRANKPARLSVVLGENGVAQLDGIPWLAASLMYGSGLCLMKALRLREKDMDFGRGEITVRSGKGGRDRRTVLPAPLKSPLRARVERVRILHGQDLLEGLAPVYLPHALARKYTKRGGNWGAGLSEVSR